ncbi:MAG: hypothetical protein KatS3mg077_2901 [Candidatus Binatia bacterium]|nr:MAG: hypothetical protein KatS3mg077_2901 [Candidatus Binatia bacterium]
MTERTARESVKAVEGRRLDRHLSQLWMAGIACTWLAVTGWPLSGLQAEVVSQGPGIGRDLCLREGREIEKISKRGAIDRVTLRAIRAAVRRCEEKEGGVPIGTAVPSNSQDSSAPLCWILWEPRGSGFVEVSLAFSPRRRGGVSYIMDTKNDCDIVGVLPVR